MNQTDDCAKGIIMSDRFKLDKCKYCDKEIIQVGDHLCTEKTMSLTSQVKQQQAKIDALEAENSVIKKLRENQFKTAKKLDSQLSIAVDALEEIKSYLKETHEEMINSDCIYNSAEDALTKINALKGE